MKFQIFGDYATVDETVLEQFNSLDEAIRWVHGFVRGGNFGGYDNIQVIRFAEDDEAITEYIVVDHT